jgi:hypothetical protein
VFTQPAKTLRPPLAVPPRPGPAPRCSSHLPGLWVTRHQRGFTHVRPSGLPLRLRSRMERERFGFFPELRTPRLPATHVRAGTGLEHWPEAMPPTSSSALQPASSLAPCDLVSHVLSPVIAHEQPHQISRPECRKQAAACGRTISDLMKLCSRQQAGTTSHQRSILPVTGRGTVFRQGSKPGKHMCSPAGGHHTRSLPDGGLPETH